MEDHVAYITAITESAWSNLTPLERKQIREALDELVRERDEYFQMVFADITAENKERRSYNAQGIRMRAERAEAALEKITEMHDGEIEQDGTESDAQIFAWADDFVVAHGIARAALSGEGISQGHMMDVKGDMGGYQG